VPALSSSCRPPGAATRGASFDDIVSGRKQRGGAMRSGHPMWRTRENRKSSVEAARIRATRPDRRRTVAHSMTSSRRTSCRIFAIRGPVKRLNRSLAREASGDHPRSQLVGHGSTTALGREPPPEPGTKRMICTAGNGGGQLASINADCRRPHRLAPVSTKSISRPPQREHTSLLCQSRTAVSAP